MRLPEVTTARGKALGLLIDDIGIGRPGISSQDLDDVTLVAFFDLVRAGLAAEHQNPDGTVRFRATATV